MRNIPVFLGHLVLMGLLTGCEAMRSVDQGLYNATEAISERDRITGQRTLSTASRGQQIAQGNAVVEQVIAAEKKRVVRLMVN